MEEIDNLQVGSLVTSTKGRDEKKVYLVLKKVDENYYLLVDGDHKKLANPKLKKIKHIKSLNIVLEKLQTKINENSKIFDSEIYSAIKKALENK